MNNIEIISGFKFASIADVIFSGVFLKSQIENLNLKENIEDHIGESEYVFVRKKKFELKENQIVFCKTEYIITCLHVTCHTLLLNGDGVHNIIQNNKQVP